MLLIPAIDIKDGKCVRLKQGDMNDATVFSDDPLEMAARWVGEGARRLHIVDLDGAAQGRPANADIIREITRAHADIPIQVGGGIRDEDTVESYIDAGVAYVIIGTRAVNEPHFIGDLCAEFPTHVMIALDAKDGRVATDGWSKMSKHGVIETAQRLEQDGIDAIIFTDIGKDGMLVGVNIEATLELADAIRIPVIASGGIHNLENVKKLAQVAERGIAGAITGRAIYTGALDFAEGQRAADQITGGA